MNAPVLFEGLGALTLESAKAYKAILTARGIDITGLTVLQVRNAIRAWATDKTQAQRESLLLDLALAPLIRD